MADRPSSTTSIHDFGRIDRRRGFGSFDGSEGVYVFMHPFLSCIAPEVYTIVEPSKLPKPDRSNVCGHAPSFAAEHADAVMRLSYLYGKIHLATLLKGIIDSPKMT